MVRSLRLERDWTLSDLSERTRLPISSLSKIETGKMSLSYEKLIKISKALDVDIARLFGGEDSEATTTVFAGRRSITRAGKGPGIQTATYRYAYPAADVLNKSLNPMIVEVTARSIEEFDDLMRHPGEEFALVLEGAVDFHCDLYAPARLETGDAIYFDGSMGHGYVAVTPGPCRILSVCSASDEELQSAITPLDRVEVRRAGQE